jgi:tRNA(Ile)-lysidine synthase
MAGAGGGAGRRGRARSLPRPPAVAAVLQQVAAFSRRHSLFQPGQHVLVAVSGGPDSICLLHALVRLERLLRIRAACFHFDHGLRPDSARDGAYVARQARSLGVRFLLSRARTSPARGESVEAWARTERYAAIDDALEALGGGVAAVAHTADDQAETVLLALLRGASIDGLAGMRPYARPVVRPLLGTSRSQTEAFCRALRLRPIRDPMNADPRYLRAAARTRLLPFAEDALGRNVRPAIVDTAGRLRLDADLLDRLADQAAHEAVAMDGEDVLLDVWMLGTLDPALRSRVIVRGLVSSGLSPESSHVDAVAALVGATPGRRASLPGPLIARRERGYVRLSRPSPGTGR